MVAEMVGKEGGVMLEPIAFSAGQVELGKEQGDYLSKLTALLQERPNIVLNICGGVSEQDRAALLAAEQAAASDAAVAKSKEKAHESQQTPTKKVQITNEQLLTLASERTDLIKEWLIGQGIEASRLFTCHPDMEGAEKQPPQVELSL